MSLSKVTKEGVDGSKKSYAGSKNPFITNFHFLQLKASATPFKFRVLPNNSDEVKFGKEYNSYAICVPQHYGVGANKSESLWCPEQIAPKAKVTCPLCEEFRDVGKKSSRACSKHYYYLQVVLLSKHEGIPNYKEDGKKLMVYMLKVAKKSVFDPIADYYDDDQRAIPDMTDLKDGCAISIKVTETTIDQDGKPKKVPQFQTQILEANKADLTKVIDIADIKDLRLLTEFIPSELAVKEAMEGMPVADAIAVAGKVSSITGKQVGGTTSVGNTAKEEPAVDADSEIEIVDEIPEA